MKYEGEFVEEEFRHERDKLPNLHTDVEEPFPRAVASREEKGADDVTPCSFERRGEEIGKASSVVKAGNSKVVTGSPN